MNQVIHKLSEDGMVAVLHSPGFGAGWYTWNRELPQLAFDPAIVKYVETQDWDQLKEYMELKYPDAYTGGMTDLKVTWLPEGTLFRINEYDGSESIEIKEAIDWMVA